MIFNASNSQNQSQYREGEGRGGLVRQIALFVFDSSLNSLVGL